MDSEKELFWLKEGVKTPPFSRNGRLTAGVLLGLLQMGETPPMPHARSLNRTLGPRCGELRITDLGREFRIVYRTDPDVVVIVAVFEKKTQEMPRKWIEVCKARLKAFDSA